MTGGISIEHRDSYLSDCNEQDPCRARKNSDRPRDDGEETMRCRICKKDHPYPFSFVRYSEEKLCWPTCSDVWARFFDEEGLE